MGEGVVVVVAAAVVVVVVVVVVVWCGGCGADCAITKTRLTMSSASALVPSAGLTSRKPPAPVPSEGRFQASPGANLTQPQVEEKDCEARPPHPLTPSKKKKGAIFSIVSALDGSGMR